MCDYRTIRARLERTLERLYDHDVALFDRRVHERTIAARLAMYLQGEFPHWHVDCEYNRDDYRTKCDQDVPIFPDVIVHRRGGDNLLALEMKAFWSRVGRAGDIRRLCEWTLPPRHYSLGAYVKLGKDSHEVLWYADGEEVGVLE